MRFEYTVIPEWPPLAWLARCEKGSDCVAVSHGPQVESTDDWFCEAAWAGSYDEGGFDRTDIVAGSGGRARGDTVCFVTSGSTVDRLQSIEGPDAVWVSNSLPALLAATDGSLDPSYPRYKQDLISIVRGIDRYNRWLHTTAGPVQLTYFDNLRWNGTALAVEPKPLADRCFPAFSHYYDFLRESIAGLAENMATGKRRYPYQFLGTMSSGYDSTTVATLARSAGAREVLCFDRAKEGESDTGEVAARHLGLVPLPVRGDAWRSMSRPEIPFIAGNAMGEEVRFSAAADHLGRRVLLTGYHGDKVWDTHTKDLGSHIRRGDPSGSGLMEYRLWVGFLHCPVPFWGVRQIRDVHAISTSPEMTPWDVGGDYNRPICRRIAESAGIPRTAFGQRKLAASTMLQEYDEFLTPLSMDDYLAWTRAHRWDYMRHGRMPPIVNVDADRRIYHFVNGLVKWLKRQPAIWRLADPIDRPWNLRCGLFPWAVERAKERYAAQMPDHLTESRLRGREHSVLGSAPQRFRSP
ncbi:MAG: hypothetical protein IT515_13815 [Burkholderiales bacterium]|nr:hypothetical protein [Burkholderiales bacterium]